MVALAGSRYTLWLIGSETDWPFHNFRASSDADALEIAQRKLEAAPDGEYALSRTDRAPGILHTRTAAHEPELGGEG